MSPLRAGASLRPWGLSGDAYTDLKREGPCLAPARQKCVTDEKKCQTAGKTAILRMLSSRVPRILKERF